MKKIFIMLITIILVLLLIIYINSNINNKNNNMEIDENKKIEGDSVDKITITIDENDYILNLENNETVEEFLKLIPTTYVMNDLNDNEKYIYLDTQLPTNMYDPKKINKGDVMLYGNNCLVIFYKSFITSYSYTKIGYIDNLPDLNNGDITVSLNINKK